MAIETKPEPGTQGRVLPLGKLPPAPPHQVDVYDIATGEVFKGLFQVDARPLLATGLYSLTPPEPKAAKNDPEPDPAPSASEASEKKKGK